MYCFVCLGGDRHLLVFVCVFWVSVLPYLCQSLMVSVQELFRVEVWMTASAVCRIRTCWEQVACSICKGTQEGHPICRTGTCWEKVACSISEGTQAGHPISRTGTCWEQVACTICKGTMCPRPHVHFNSALCRSPTALVASAIHSPPSRKHRQAIHPKQLWGLFPSIHFSI